jgi:hypothetical protein
MAGLAEAPMDTTLSARESYAGPNSPDLKKDVKVHVPAFTSLGQVTSIIRSLKYENREREIKNSRILAKYNAERPYRQQDLAADGLTWKKNFSTKPLANLIDKAVPRLTTAVRNMRFLTSSALPDRFPNAAEKTEEFRREITKLCRAREGWDELVNEISMENLLFGYTAVGWLTEWSWFPKHFQQDKFLVPEGTKHTAKSAPLIGFKENYLLHELFELIADPAAAKTAGWDVEEVIQSLNNAVPTNMRSGFSEPWRIYAELNRESSVLTSYTASKAVEVWHVFVAEVDGFISHLAFDATSEKQLFYKEKQFAKMADVAAFFSFQYGDGKLHGSKGIGREIYGMAGVLDRARNEVVDRLELSGKVLLQCDERDLKRFRMSVVGAAILVTNGFNVQQTNIDGNVEGFLKLDQFLTDLLDQIAGSTSPKAIDGERVTKAAVDLLAARENEKRDAIIERFLTQFARMMTTLQKRACDPHTNENDAKEMQQRLLQVMSPEELAYLANQPAVETVSDYSDMEQQKIVLLAQEANGNPLYNQRELQKRKLTALIDSEFAEAVLLGENDPTVQAENTRQQQLEMLAIGQGQPVPVSPRDNHQVHVDVLRNVVSGLIGSGAHDDIEPILQAIGTHAQAHIEAAEQQGMAQQMADAKSWLAGLQNTLEHLQAQQQKAQELAQQQQQQLAEQGQPPGTPPIENAAPAAPPPTQ